jgi:hypothetical protein
VALSVWNDLESSALFSPRLILLSLALVLTATAAPSHGPAGMERRKIRSRLALNRRVRAEQALIGTDSGSAKRLEAPETKKLEFWYALLYHHRNL